MNRSRVFTSLPAMVLFVAMASCSCESETRRLGPVFGIEGAAPGDDDVDWLIDFGILHVGSTAEPEIYFVNEGSSVLRLWLEDEVSAPFVLGLTDGPVEVPVGGREDARFRFAPREVGSYEAILAISTNDEKGSLQRVRMIGEAVQPDFTCAPERIDFGKVVRGERAIEKLSCTNHLEIPLALELDSIEGDGARFFFAATGDGSSAVDLGPGETTEIEVVFYAEVPGRHTATLVVRPGMGTADRVELEGETLAAALQVEPSGCLDFGPVEIYGTKELTLVVRNYSDEELLIEGMRLEGDARDFRIVSPRPGRPIAVAPRGEEALEIMVAYRPTTPTRHEAELVLTTTDPLRSVMHVCLQGRSGTAQIACNPSSLDFGAVALGFESQRSFVCTNTGEDIGNLQGEPLYVYEVRSENERFRSYLRNPNGSEGPRPRGYRPGESFFVDVSFLPEAESVEDGAITIRSSAIGDAELQIPVSGFGRDLPPCQFYLQPPSLRFGTVSPGDKREADFSLVNEGDEACLINNLRLSEDSAPAFTTEEIVSAEVGPRQTYPVTVAFAPTEVGRAEGAVEFYVSNPEIEQPMVVPLRGMGSDSCLEIQPSALEFGGMAPGCSTREQLVSIVNRCEPPVEIRSVEIDGAYPWFRLASVPLLPQTLVQGARFEFYVAYQPDAMGEHRGQVDLELGDSSLQTIPLLGSGSDQTEIEEVFTSQRPQVDVLWVIDNSSSFARFQDILKINLPAFLRFAVEWDVDFHLGVTTSGIYPYEHDFNECYGGAEGGENGRLFPVDNSSPRILNSRMSWDVLQRSWERNVIVGTCHVHETLYEAAKRALSPPLIDLAKAPGTPWPSDGNLGFLREDAALSIILIHDESEESPDPVDDYVAFYQSLKPATRRDTVKVHAISGGLDTGPCLASACPRCMRGPELTGGVWFDICTPVSDTEAWETKLSEMSRAAFGFERSLFLRAQPADENGDGRIDDADIEVLRDGVPWPRKTPDDEIVWYYDALKNSLEIAPKHAAIPGEEIKVRYRIACL